MTLLLGLALLSLAGPETGLAHARDPHQSNEQEPLAEEAPLPTAGIPPGAPDERVDRPALHPEPPREEPTTEPSHEYPPEGVPRPLAWLGKFHPPLTHFPIALLTAAALAELIRMRRPSVLLHHAVRFCVGFGAGGALAAAMLGWLFAGFRVADDEWVMTAHRWVGSATALSAVIVFVLCERSYAAGKPSRAFRMALFAEALLVATTGFLGGSLIYGLDHYAW